MPQLGGVPRLGCLPAWGLLGLCRPPHCCNSGLCSAWQPSEAPGAVKGGRAGRKGPRLFQSTGKPGPRQGVIDSRGGGGPCEQVSGVMGSSLVKGELLLETRAGRMLVLRESR